MSTPAIPTGSTALPVIGNAPRKTDDEIRPLKPPVDPSTLAHKQLLGGEFWQRLPAYREVTEAQFLDSNWQSKNTITKPERLLDAVAGLVSPEFIEDCRKGFELAPMSLRVSPDLRSLIDWEQPYEDPLRIRLISAKYQ